MVLPWAGDASLGYEPVGYQNAPGYPGSLTDGSNITVVSNTTYKYYKNLGANSPNGGLGTPGSPVSGVTCIGCEWETSGATAAALPLFAIGSGVTLQYCTIAPAGAYAGTVTPANQTQAEGYQYAIVCDGTQAVPGTLNTFCAPLTVDHCDIWGFANATKIAAGTQAAPHTFSYTWIHDSRPNTNGLDHTDGLGCPGGGSESYLTIKHCQIIGNGDTQAIAYQQSTSGSFDHVTCTDNLLGGFGTTVNFGGGGASDACTNMYFARNTFTTRKFEPTFVVDATNFATGPGCAWVNNKWQVPGDAVWGQAAHDGWYWVPNAIAVPGTDDTPFVQQGPYMSFQVTAASGGAGQLGTSLTIYVLTGQAASQPGALASLASAILTSITPQGSGSFIAVSPFGLSGGPYTANANTSLTENAGEPDGTQRLAGHSTAAPTQGVSTPYGCTSAQTALSVALAEFLASGTLALDGSSPASVYAGATSVVTANFAPPAGSLLAALAQSNGGAGVATMSITDNSGLGIIWTERVKVNGSGQGYNGIWTGAFPAASGGGSSNRRRERLVAA